MNNSSKLTLLREAQVVVSEHLDQFTGEDEYYAKLFAKAQLYESNLKSSTDKKFNVIKEELKNIKEFSELTNYPEMAKQYAIAMCVEFIMNTVKDVYSLQ